MENERIVCVMRALAGASTANEYRAAKLTLAGMDRLTQLAMVDFVREARARLLAIGVL
jgi:hypothetical protein